MLIRKEYPRGFTLIELLVVVAIIALLTAILLPSLRRAREKTREIYCLSNMKSVGMMMHYYEQAHTDWLQACRKAPTQ